MLLIDGLKFNTILDLVLDWFKFNSMVANPSKFQLIFPGTPSANISIKLGNIVIKSVENVKLLGVKIDSKLSFIDHVKELCNKSNAKIRALRRVRPFLSEDKAKLLVNAYILSPFNYCPLIWMFCGKEGDRLIRQCHYRALKSMTKSNKSYCDLLLDCNSMDIHTRNLNLMLLEVFKSLNGLGPEIMQNMFIRKQSRYELRSGSVIEVPIYINYNRVFSINTFDFRATMTWNSLPSEIKSQRSLNLFKLALKGIKLKCCCKICT